ncbi:hypothetical protein ACHQM5_015304 [Ranunculus cassubicifolius]
MKLRIRSLQTKETIKIETPNPSSLQILKDIIANKLSIPSESLHLSLNRQDEIIASPMDSLNSLGIASGDLIYYTQNPNAFSADTPIQIQNIQVSDGGETLSSSMEICDEASTSGGEKIETLGAPVNPQLESHQIETSGVENSLKSSEISDELMDCDEELGEKGEALVKNLSRVPGFLQKVYKEEIGDASVESKYKLLIISVHAAFLESGFVCFDPVFQKKIDGFCLPEGWGSISTISVHYTIPDLLSVGKSPETVCLKFQTMGKFVSVHGSLTGGKPVGFFRLDASRFVPSVSVMCRLNGDSTSEVNEPDESSKSYAEREVFELWKVVKDGLALPLLIDLCEKAGLEPPPCFTCLPTELKLKVLELLPGVDIARVSCVSSELRYMSSNNDLWKRKYMEEFSLSDYKEMPNDNWKEKYVMSWERSKRKRRYDPLPSHDRTPYLPLRSDPWPFRFPGMVGGDYDRTPFGFPGVRGGLHDIFPAPFGSNQGLRLPARRNFTRTSGSLGFDV